MCTVYIFIYSCSQNSRTWCEVNVTLTHRVCVGVCRQVVLPCASFCEAAREGCEPVLQMVNASWPEFLRCSQFANGSSSPVPLPTLLPPDRPTGLPAAMCYTPRQIKGKPCEYTHTQKYSHAWTYIWTTQKGKLVIWWFNRSLCSFIGGQRCAVGRITSCVCRGSVSLRSLCAMATMTATTGAMKLIVVRAGCSEVVVMVTGGASHWAYRNVAF